MYLEERRQAILNLVTQQGRVSVTELGERFGVSEVTIRTDLQALATRGLLLRTYGGAIPAAYGLQELSLTKRRQEQVAQKLKIGQVAAAMVKDGEAIFLDSSSTALAVAQHLKQRRDLTVITNSLVVAYEMLGLSNVTVVMPGGTLHHDTVSLIDAEGLAQLEKLNIVRGFFGAHGLSLSAGLTDVSAPEAEIKRPLVRLCRQVIALLDATKWGREGIASFAEIRDVHCIVTDRHAPAGLVEQVRAMGVEITQV